MQYDFRLFSHHSIVNFFKNSKFFDGFKILLETRAEFRAGLNITK